ncbi:hypothetical protein, partial [Salmonella sp. s54412]|uniref:TLD domain-containing protein n=1 Tax=Salmonella sp. s54412 TaxID=3160128 RepID=UPI0037547035
MAVNRKRTRGREKKKKKKKAEKKESQRKPSSWSVCSIEESLLPEMVGKSEILTECDVLQLSQSLPSRTIGHSWHLIYSTSIHGISL